MFTIITRTAHTIRWRKTLRRRDRSSTSRQQMPRWFPCRAWAGCIIATLGGQRPSLASWEAVHPLGRSLRNESDSDGDRTIPADTLAADGGGAPRVLLSVARLLPGSPPPTPLPPQTQPRFPQRHARSDNRSRSSKHDLLLDRAQSPQGRVHTMCAFPHRFRGWVGVCHI